MWHYRRTNSRGGGEPLHIEDEYQDENYCLVLQAADTLLKYLPEVAPREVLSTYRAHGGTLNEESVGTYLTRLARRGYLRMRYLPRATGNGHDLRVFRKSTYTKTWQTGLAIL